MLDFRRMLPSARRKPHGPRSSRGPRWPSSWLNDRKRDWIIAAHRGFGRDRCERACIAVQHKSADGAVVVEDRIHKLSCWLKCQVQRGSAAAKGRGVHFSVFAIDAVQFEQRQAPREIRRVSNLRDGKELPLWVCRHPKRIGRLYALVHGE